MYKEGYITDNISNIDTNLKEVYNKTSSNDIEMKESEINSNSKDDINPKTSQNQKFLKMYNIFYNENEINT